MGVAVRGRTGCGNPSAPPPPDIRPDPLIARWSPAGSRAEPACWGNRNGRGPCRGDSARPRGVCLLYKASLLDRDRGRVPGQGHRRDGHADTVRRVPWPKVLFVARRLSTLDVKLVVGVGGSFNVEQAKLVAPPRAMQRIGAGVALASAAGTQAPPQAVSRGNFTFIALVFRELRHQHRPGRQPANSLR
jgi:hypothetical protein